MNIYFDNAATSPVISEVADTMSFVMSGKFGNPSSIHSYGREARVIVENARGTIADCLGVSPSEIYFTSGGTEAINTIIRGYLRTHPQASVITSQLEHYAVLNCLEDIKKEKNTDIVFLPHDETGNINLNILDSELSGKPGSLAILMHANNETGTILPIAEAAEICKKYDAFFLSDSVQSIGKIPVRPVEMKVNSVICSAHKLHGPKGIGFFYLAKGNKLNPLLFGGSQEKNMRAGTENVPAIAGMAKALEIATSAMESTRNYISLLKSDMIQQLASEFPEVEINGNTGDKSLHTILSVSFPFNDKSEMLQYNLDINGIAVSGGSACSSGSSKPSHVIHELKGSRKLVNLRFSFSKFNTLAEVNECINLMKKLLK